MVVAYLILFPIFRVGYGLVTKHALYSYSAFQKIVFVKSSEYLSLNLMQTPLLFYSASY